MSKQPAKKPGGAGVGGGGWGSMFSSAVAGLESRLDTILADEPEGPSTTSTRAQAREKEMKARPRTGSAAGEGRRRAGSGSLGTGDATVSREASRTRGSDRLAERLARATAAKESSPARVGSPLAAAAGAAPLPAGAAPPTSSTAVKAGTGSARASVEESRKQDVDEQKVMAAEEEVSGGLLSSSLPINPARVSADSLRPSFEVGGNEDVASSRPSSELPNGVDMHAHIPSKSTAEVEAEMAQLCAEHEAGEKQRQEEMHAHLERIDALQAKLQYLAKETVAAAKEANASMPAGGLEAKLAEKDERIALLMEEGEKLSKNELRLSQTLKKLRAKAVEEEKGHFDTKKRLERVEKAESDLKARLKRAEVAQRQANDKAKTVDGLERQVEDLRVARDKASEQIQALTVQLHDAERKTEQALAEAKSKAAEIDKGKIASLENELEDAQIEKKLAEDRARVEIATAKDEAARLRERFAVSEVEMKHEIAGLESRVEAMRARVEEVDSEGSSREGSTMLLRQIETLQSQYSLAKENWETIEGSTNARLSALEVERDEATRREAEARKKARDATTKTRKADEELESVGERMRSLERDLKDERATIASLRQSVTQADAALADAKADWERQRKIWESEVEARIEGEKVRWQRGSTTSVNNNGNTILASIRHDSTSIATSRKLSHAEPPSRRTMHKLTTHDLALHNDRPSNRRGSGMPVPARHTPDRDMASPALSRHESTTSFDHSSFPPTPSIEVDQDYGSEDGRDLQTPSPHQQGIFNDLVSVSTAAPGRVGGGVGGTGPSVQLVERMSAAVRRLESEKATHREEMARLAAQRDEARDQVVTLMREVEGVKTEKGKASGLEKQLGEVKSRYEAALEMLGEREEEVDELKQDVSELKRLYRELVEEKLGGK